MNLQQAAYNRLKNQYEVIESILFEAAGSRLKIVPPSGKWTIQDNIAHLATYQPIFIEDAVITYCKIQTERLLLFETITNLTSAQLNRKGIHKKYGELTLHNWTEFFLLHGPITFS
jgi:hypothetical protein